MAFLHEKRDRLHSRIWMGCKVFEERFAKTTQRMSTLSLCAISALVGFLLGVVACYLDYKKPIDEYLKKFR